jgi:hypothetical protein
MKALKRIWNRRKRTFKLMQRDMKSARIAVELDLGGSNGLSSSPKGFELTGLLAAVAKRACELVGDTCAIRLVSKDNETLITPVIYHRDPAEIPVLEELFAKLPRQRDRGITMNVIESARGLRVPVIYPEELEPAMPPEFMGYFRRFPVHSAMVLPLAVNGVGFGAMCFVRHTPDNPYTAGEQALVQELIDRAARSIHVAGFVQR